MLYILCYSCGDCSKGGGRRRKEVRGVRGMGGDVVVGRILFFFFFLGGGLLMYRWGGGGGAIYGAFFE